MLLGGIPALENATVFPYLKSFSLSAHDILVMIQMGSCEDAQPRMGAKIEPDQFSIYQKWFALSFGLFCRLLGTKSCSVLPAGCELTLILGLCLHPTVSQYFESLWSEIAQFINIFFLVRFWIYHYYEILTIILTNVGGEGHVGYLFLLTRPSEGLGFYYVHFNGKKPGLEPGTVVHTLIPALQAVSTGT